MLKISRILRPIDFSEFSVKAYDYAQSLAWHYKASLLLEDVIDLLTPYPFYAVPETYLEVCRQLLADGEQQLEEIAKTHTRCGVQPECCLQDGIVPGAVLDLAEAQTVSLIVMGPVGRAPSRAYGWHSCCLRKQEESTYEMALIGFDRT